MEEVVSKPTLSARLKSFFIECKRVWQVTKKPTKEELKTIVKVTGIGTVILGFLGFIINLLWQLGLK